jgi:hypothetical protein
MAKSRQDSHRRAKSAVVRKRRFRQVVKKQRELAKELLEFLPRSLMEEIAEETGVDIQVKHLFGLLMVLLLVYSIVTEKDESLRTLEDVYNSKGFRVFSGKGGHQTRHSSIGSRLSTIKVDYFERLYEGFLENVKKQYGKRLERDFGWLERFDSTMLALSAALTDIGMRVGVKPKKGQGKVQVKVTLGLSGLLPTSVKIFTDQKHLSEDTALFEAIQAAQADKSNGAVVFDMGLKGRKKLAVLGEKCFFVTRLKNPRYQLVRSHKQVKGRKAGDLRLEKDLIVRLYPSGNGEPLPTEFRLVIATCELGEHVGKTFYFLTNILDLSASQIAEIYHRRWDIEVFFRFLKQEIGLRNLLSYNENGIRAVLYLRLLTATMLKIYMWLNHRNDYKMSKLAFAEEIQWEITLTLVQLAGGDAKTLERKLPDFQGLV